jgi:1-acyl-sn-glycerol-3-phosphate acyltransferase
MIRSILFYFLIFFFGAIIPIIFSPAFIIRSKRLADYGAKIWSFCLVFFLKKICQVDYQIIGLEKLPQESCIIACKHQSMWETAIMHLILERPVYAYKKELLKIPFYGWFVQIMSGISVDRNGGAKSLKDLIKQSKKYLNNNQKIVIFPQGTRVPISSNIDQYPYQSGIAALYINCKSKVVPVALNSGAFWPKKGLINSKGTIKIKFLDPIEPGLNKKEFMNKLQKTIEYNSNQLI